MARFVVILFFVSANTIAADIRLLNCYAENMNGKGELSPALFSITQQICEKWRDKFEKISWQLIGSENKKALTLDEKIISSEIGELKNGRVWVKTSALQDGQRKDQVLWFRIKGYATVWAVKRDISVNSVVLEKDIMQRSADITTENITHDQIVKEPIGMFVRKSLRKGTTISTANVSSPPLIQQNKSIQVLVENNGLQITAKAIALSTGWNIGDTITVLVSGASEKTEAVVTKRGWANVSI